MKICLVACSSKKHDYPMRAEDIYDKSALFRKSKQYARTGGFDKWFILSSKHQLLLPGEIIEPYDLYLGSLNKEQRILWGAGVYMKLKPFLSSGTYVEILAGRIYVDAVLPYIQNGAAIGLPLKSKGIGEQLQWLTKQTQ
jgi:hypothetical protein